MRKLLSKAISVLLVLCLTVSAFPVISFASAEAAKADVLLNELPIVPPAGGDVSYHVEYYLQDLEGDGYTLEETEALTGKAGASVEAEQANYPGFTLNSNKSVMTGTIAADGSTVLKLYYDRNLYTVTWKVGQNATEETYRYAATPSFKGSTDRADGEHGSNFVFTGWDKELVPVTKNVTYRAVYDVDCEAFILNDDSWATLQLALEHAKAGDTVRIEKDLTISKNMEIPAGVTLLLPCMDNDSGYIKRTQLGLTYLMNPNGTDTSGQGVGPNAKLYRTVTVAEGVQLTVKGALMVNAVTGRKATANSDQDVTGGYAVLQLNGNITVESGGSLDAFGYVKGSGAITAKKGGTVGDLYVVRHWRGGSQAMSLYNAGLYPMNENDCHNIETLLRIEYGATLEGIVKMYAQGAYYYTRFPQVDNTNGLIRLNDPSSFLLRTYVDGREHFEIVNGAAFAKSSMTVIGTTLSTGDYIYPIDGDIDFVLNAGEYHMQNDFKFLPGAAMKINAGASLTVDEGKTLVFYREFDNGDFNKTTAYPDRPAALLTVAAGGKFTNAGTFAGNVYTESADILIGADPVWEAVTYEAKCLAGSLPQEEFTLALNHTLSITRPHHTWKFGEDKSIVWCGGPADYSAVEAAIAMIPEDLSIYTDESVQALNDAVAAVRYDLLEEEQAQVDAWAQAIKDALAALAPKEGMPADYSAVKAALALAETYDLNLYTDASRQALEEAKAAVVYGLTEEYQAQVDAWAKAIMDAINALVFKPADYSRVEAAKRMIPPDLSIYTDESLKRLQDALDAVEDDVLINEQAKVDAWANAIIEAIAALVVKPADYSKLDAALASVPADLSGYTTESVTALNAVLAEVKEGLPITEQAQVDAWAEAVAAAVKGLVKKCDGGADCPGKIFTDMPPATHWAHEGIDFALSHGLFEGMSKTTFAPDGKMTRAMLVTVLWRLAGKPIEGRLTFGDVKEDAWYADAVKWASKHNIVNGISYGVFAPDMLVTRAQLATILHRYAGEPEGSAALNGFADQSKVDSWSKDAICWAIDVGILKGSRDGAGRLWLNPQDSATRAEVATILMRFIVNNT
ncbi:MAG: S-layer homology domain-containing protein [Oscillospiraceae bacterium]|nr:S-layer homology domain-containing protein [Oscillospiraceae bacterium]